MRARRGPGELLLLAIAVLWACDTSTGPGAADAGGLGAVDGALVDSASVADAVVADAVVVDAAGADAAAVDASAADVAVADVAAADARFDAHSPAQLCVVQPTDPSQSCWHSFGGLYGDGACSSSYQCCAGAWQAGTGGCGACTCTETSGAQGCVPSDQGEEICFPTFDGTVVALPSAVRARMDGVSWRQGCPVGLDALSYLELPHWGMDGAIHRGELVVATSVAIDVLAAFAQIYTRGFPIERMALIDDYGADDDLSMAANNSSAFNCRLTTGGSSYSQHSYGTAIDINPVQNPYVSGAAVLPPAGADYVDRDDVRPGMIVDPGAALGAFRVIGWGWGGSWSSIKDYQHFSQNGG